MSGTLKQTNATGGGINTESRENKILGLHHHAYLVEDMEATRHFYEDILGLPLVGTWVERLNPVTGKPDNYVHTFFELADGSCLAFFQFKEKESNKAQSLTKFTNNNPFAHHIAFEVDGMDMLREYQRRLEAAGINVVETDHGYVYSMYFYDPSGMQMELTTKVEKTDEMMKEAQSTAREMLDRWMAEDDLATNNTERGAGWVKSH